MIYQIMVWSMLAMSFVPTARRVSRHLAQRRPAPAQGAHAKPAKPAKPAEPETVRERLQSTLYTVVTIICAFIVIANPHGLAYWLPLGCVIVMLLVEPFNWLTDYLIRRANQQDAT